MGIHPYGLFGTNESNTPFGSDYELKRQLAARQAQLDALKKKPSLTLEEDKKKEQLSRTVNQLNDKLYKKNTPATSTNNDKSPTIDTAKPSNINNSNIKKYAEGTVIAKSPNSIYQKNPNQNVQPKPDYLKGFFLDLKI